MKIPSKKDIRPVTHTAAIANVEGMFWKLAWDIDQFDDIQRGRPELIEPLAFAAINVCISATSLRDWVAATYVSQMRENGQSAAKSEVVDHIYRHVRQQRMCEAIANTAKHSRFDESGWKGGSVRVTLLEPSEDDPGGYVLEHVHEGGAYTSMALKAFESLERNWWGELQNLGFAFPHTGPEWRQQHIRKRLGKAL